MKSLKTDAVYLGGPKFLTKARSKDFKFLQDRLESRVKGGGQVFVFGWSMHYDQVSSPINSIIFYVIF